MQLEEKNEAIAKQNLDITLEKFRIGTITTLEFRTAQLNYINAKVRNTNTQYQAKLSEIALKELAGNLSFWLDLWLKLQPRIHEFSWIDINNSCIRGNKFF